MSDRPLQVLEEDPFNASTPLRRLAEDITPTESFFVRNHFPVPQIDVRSWRLAIGGLVDQAGQLGVEDLEALDQHEVVVTFECAGNGRARMRPAVPGVQWDDLAVSTASFSGPRLKDVLGLAGVSPEAVEAVFRGHDHGLEGGKDIAFERSLPIDECLRPDAIVALEMNGRPLTADHGAPARLVVPGWYGVANVKWLAAVDLVAEPFDGWFQKDRYVIVGDDGERARPLSRMQVKSLLHAPRPGTRVRVGKMVELTGRAWVGRGRVARVEVSVDGGRNWDQAALDQAPGAAAWRGFSYAWTPRQAGEVELMARATDADGHSQPTKVPWNKYGYEQNAVVPVPVVVEPE